jgi:chromosome segregation ATPase
MEMDQIRKQVDWLDDERRKDSTKISSLEERLAALENNISPLSKQLKDLSGEITRLNTLITRMDNFDEKLQKTQISSKEQDESLEKQFRRSMDENDKMLRSEIRSLERALGDVNKELDQLPELKRSMTARIEEENRLSGLLDELREKITTVRRDEEEYNRTIRLLDDGRRQDSKRLTDLQGEVSALRKRMDDQRGKLELASSTVKKLETRLNELVAVETERREEVSTFINNQSLRDVERERVWKDWQTRFQLIESQAGDIENTLQSLDSTHRSVKRSQQTVDELAQKIERRINEITEMQRLSDERFRQEWVTFKADDQKRWTNYTLTTEEQKNETLRQHEKLSEKVTFIEDELQDIQDMLDQMKEHTEKRLQSLLALNHEWVSSYERSVGRSR